MQPLPIGVQTSRKFERKHTPYFETQAGFRNRELYRGFARYFFKY